MYETVPYDLATLAWDSAETNQTMVIVADDDETSEREYQMLVTPTPDDNYVVITDGVSSEIPRAGFQHDRAKDAMYEAAKMLTMHIDINDDDWHISPPTAGDLADHIDVFKDHLSEAVEL